MMQRGERPSRRPRGGHLRRPSTASRGTRSSTTSPTSCSTRLRRRWATRRREFVVETIIALIESNPTAPDGNPFFSVGPRQPGDDGALRGRAGRRDLAMEKQLDDSRRRIRVTRPVARRRKTRAWSSSRSASSTRSSRAQTAQYSGAAGAGSNVFDKGTEQPAVPASCRTTRSSATRTCRTRTTGTCSRTPRRIPAFASGSSTGRRALRRDLLKNPEVRTALGGGGQDPYTFELGRASTSRSAMDFGVAPVDPRGAFRAVVA